MKMEESKNALISIALLIIALGLLSSCSQNQSDELEIITISNEGSFSAEECSARGLEGKVIMLESSYCGACRSTMQNFLDACKEMNITPIILDLSQSENYQKMLDEYKIQIRYTPTFIFGCDYYIGATSKQEYIRRIETMLS
ncbi:MAG: hypothetical protein PWQ87_466 [Candidatus Woesearchaeota archaeon]|nr:hypothetical protein [Candidatus Woesearchaeota archaeon]